MEPRSIEPAPTKRSPARFLAWIFVVMGVFAIGVWYATSESAEYREEYLAATISPPRELVPDLVISPARDISLERMKDGRLLMYFSTTYFNQGEGPLELRGDAAATNVKKDSERQVTQRLYISDGTYNEKPVGTFLWHQEHGHNHFTDFVEYDLEPIDAPNHPDLSGTRVKATFCVRDVSKVNMTLAFREEEAKYNKCDKNLQGVSVGWGDTYYHDYPAQNIDIASLASGTYRFTQIVNPKSIITEASYDNNRSSVILEIDTKNDRVRVLEEIPKDSPSVEHIHLEDPFKE